MKAERVVMSSETKELLKTTWGGAAHRQWAQDLWKSLAPFALPGGYANLLGRNDRAVTPVGLPTGDD